MARDSYVNISIILPLKWLPVPPSYLDLMYLYLFSSINLLSPSCPWTQLLEGGERGVRGIAPEGGPVLLFQRRPL